MTADTILARVAAACDVSIADIVSDKRSRHIVDARHLALAVLRSHFPRRSLIALGQTFGCLDHSTVLNALAQVRKRRAADPKLDRLLKELEADG